LPDPQRYKASEWPAVVARMEKNMEWMNIVVGNRHPPDEPQLRIEEINAFLVKYARKADSGRNRHSRFTAVLAPIASNQRFTLGKLFKSVLCHS